jgi:TAT (twin-arginine translocation) pathway signal sequence
MDRRQFLTTSAAVGAAAIVPRKFVRTLEDREPQPVLANAKLRLYHYDKLVLETDTTIEESVEDGNAVYGKGAEIKVTASKPFTFNKATVELADIPKELVLPLSQTYTVTPGNTLTLQADAHGLVRVEGMLTLEDLGHG